MPASGSQLFCASVFTFGKDGMDMHGFRELLHLFVSVPSVSMVGHLLGGVPACRVLCMYVYALELSA